jgi:hypothetical protein
MPNKNTFVIKPIQKFLHRWLHDKKVIVDPYARDSKIGTITNDLNTKTTAQYHEKAEDFLNILVAKGVEADAILYDPPYSPRQIKECYDSIGIKPTQQDTQDGRIKKLCRESIEKIIKPNGVILSFGWNSQGMGKKFTHKEVMLVSHGGGHNDTICVAQVNDIMELF